MGSFLLLLGHAVTKNALLHHYEPHSHISNFLQLIRSRPRTSSCIMTGTIIIIRANGSLAIPAFQYLLTKYPDYTVVLTFQNALEIDVNAKKLRDSRTQYPTSKSQLPICQPYTTLPATSQVRSQTTDSRLSLALFAMPITGTWFTNPKSLEMVTIRAFK